MADSEPVSAGDKKTLRRIGIYDFGPYELRELAYLCEAFSLERAAATRLCSALRIPLIHIGDSSYYNQASLIRLFYVLTRNGGQGFAAPGSTFKSKGLYKRNGRKVLLEIPDEVLLQAEDPAILVEMAAADGSSKTAARALSDAIKHMNAKRKAIPWTNEPKPPTSGRPPERSEPVSTGDEQAGEVHLSVHPIGPAHAL